MRWFEISCEAVNFDASEGLDLMSHISGFPESRSLFVHLGASVSRLLSNLLYFLRISIDGHVTRPSSIGS
jgi:hypothetical protein